jgi:hypothetical protein
LTTANPPLKVGIRAKMRTIEAGTMTTRPQPALINAKRALALARFLASAGGQKMAQAVSGKTTDGWKRGGCLVLAEGIAAWLAPDSGQIMGLWRHGPQTNPLIVPHHVFVLAQDLYFDGNGESTRSVFEAAWTRDGAVDFGHAHIAPYDPDLAGPSIIKRDLVASAAITKALRAELKPGRSGS